MTKTIQQFIRTIYHKRVIILLIGFFLALSIYAGWLAFGPQSFAVLSRNQALEKYLADSIQTLRLENATLQKKLFEIKGLEP